MIVRAVCHTKTSTLPGRESWQPRGFLVANDPDKVLIYLIYLATLSTLPTSLRWQPRLAVGSLDRNGRRFAAHCGAKAQAFGWTARELFGLHTPPERPAANYRRLSRYDETGLVWLLRGRSVIALTERTAAIQGATAVLTYRKLNKPALGPLGDSLDDMGAAT
jgi:hypothetical protein